jgi:hypothetical protein
MESPWDPAPPAPKETRLDFYEVPSANSLLLLMKDHTLVPVPVPLSSCLGWDTSPDGRCAYCISQDGNVHVYSRADPVWKVGCAIIPGDLEDEPRIKFYGSLLVFSVNNRSLVAASDFREELVESVSIYDFARGVTVCENLLLPPELADGYDTPSIESDLRDNADSTATPTILVFIESDSPDGPYGDHYEVVRGVPRYKFHVNTLEWEEIDSA